MKNDFVRKIIPLAIGWVCLIAFWVVRLARF